MFLRGVKGRSCLPLDGQERMEDVQQALGKAGVTVPERWILWTANWVSADAA